MSRPLLCNYKLLFLRRCNAQSDEQNDEVYELLSQWDGRAPIDGLTAMVAAVR